MCNFEPYVCYLQLLQNARVWYLCSLSERRSNYQRNSSLLSPILQQDCAAECAQSFFSALADLTEKLLLELDETITVDDVKVPGKKRRDCLFRPPVPCQRLQQSVLRKKRL